MLPTSRTTEGDTVTFRTRPDRVLPYLFDALSAEVARQVTEEWSGWRDYGHGDRRAACERMAVLVDLGRQQAAIILERRTGEPVTRWSPKRNRRELADMLEHATSDNPEDLSRHTIRRCRTEVERPWITYARENGRDPR